MRNYNKIPEQVKRAVRLHFKRGVPFADIHLQDRQKENLLRVEYVFNMYLQDPAADFFPIFYEMTKGRYKNGFSEGMASAHAFARRDELVFRYALDVLGKEQPPEHIPLNLPKKKK